MITFLLFLVIHLYSNTINAFAASSSLLGEQLKTGYSERELGITGIEPVTSLKQPKNQPIQNDRVGIPSDLSLEVNFQFKPFRISFRA